MSERSYKKQRRVLNPEDDGKRKVTFMSKVNKVKHLGLKINVTFDQKFQPKGIEGNELLSYMGVHGREHVPLCKYFYVSW